MPKAFRLAYCEFSSPNLDQELEYYTGVLGATLVETSADGAHYLSLGLDHHNIVLRQGPEAGLLTTGFQLSAGVELDQLQREILEAGVEGRNQGRRDARGHKSAGGYGCGPLLPVLSEHGATRTRLSIAGHRAYPARPHRGDDARIRDVDPVF